ncbi:MAG: peptide deformylase [Bacteroidetes bacterium GWA2_31_9b]|nr:MAG: peptide deformylase [Bacteroidetes bacterium GWA2_31_9b]
MIYPIVIYGSPVLRKVAQEIDKDYPELNKFITDMWETMYESDGLGLAAPQVGKSIRLFVIDGEPLEEDEPALKNFKKVFINAKIIESSAETISLNEGCLSIPNLREEVSRPIKIRIDYFDEHFNHFDEWYEGMAARVIQHEYDHIEGILFTDKVSPLTKRLIKGKLASISKGKFSVDYKFRLPK